jgi:anti-sigma regulatory factor (Ser/Thr protein kinase)
LQARQLGTNAPEQQISMLLPKMMISPPVIRRTTLGATPATARSARRHVRRVLGEHGVNGKVTGVVELLTSEVVTNALLHAHSASSLCVLVGPAVIRVEVDDPSSMLPTLRRAGVEAVSGRGLAIVSALAQSWGVESGPRGKRVWFEVARGEDSLAARSGSGSAWDDHNNPN